MFRSIGEQSGNPWSQSWRRRKGRLRWEGFAEKEEPGMREWRVMDDESGESMEPMEEIVMVQHVAWGRLR